MSVYLLYPTQRVAEGIINSRSNLSNTFDGEFQADSG